MDKQEFIDNEHIYILREYKDGELKEKGERIVKETLVGNNLTEAIKKAGIITYNYEKEKKQGMVVEILHTSDGLEYNIEERFISKV